MFNLINNFIIKLFVGDSSDYLFEPHIDFELEDTEPLSTDVGLDIDNCYEDYFEKCKFENKFIKIETEKAEKEEVKPEEEVKLEDKNLGVISDVAWF